MFQGITLGEYQLYASATGFDTVLVPVLLQKIQDTLITIELNSDLVELPRLTVIPEKSMYDAFVTPSSEFKPEVLLNTAGTANDINRILTLHPAVASMNIADNNSINVRGGEILENAYCIDGIEVKTINHYATDVSSGAMGFITADLVSRVRINTIMQPWLPPRNSSVIELYLKEVPEKKRSCQLDLNISGLSLQLQGTTRNDNPSYLTNFRWLDMKPLEMFTNGVWSEFGDAILKGTLALNDHHTIGSTSVISYDKTRSKATWNKNHPDADYQKELLQMYSGIYSRLHKNNLSNRLTLSFGYTHDDYSQMVTETFYDGSTLLWTDFQSSDQRKNLLLSNRLSLSIIDSTIIETGIRINVTDYFIRKSGRYGSWGDVDQIEYETGGHLQGQLKLNRLKIITGARCDYFSLTEDLGIAPYLGVSINTERCGDLTLQSTYSYQEPPILEKNYAWFVNRRYNIGDFVLQRCWQSSLLYELSIRKTHAFCAEPFIKYYNREYAYNRPYNIYYSTSGYCTHENRYVWGKIVDANGKKYVAGLEINLHNIKEMILQYRFALTLSKSKNRFTDQNWYNDENDIRVSIKLMLGTQLGKFQDIAFTCFTSEGRPYSSFDYGLPYFEDQSQWFVKRFDPTIFLSARYSFTYPGKKISFKAYVDVQNILNQTHVIAMQELDLKERGERKLNGILPTAGLTLSF